MDITFNVASGRIVANFHKNDNPDAPIAFVFHDALEAGGNMKDMAVATLFLAFAQNGFSVMRFNFNPSDDKRPDMEKGEAELTEASAAIDWLQARLENASGLWLAGVGFGAWIAMQVLMRRVEAMGYVSLYPDAKKGDWTFFSPVPVDGMLIGSEAVPGAGEEAMGELLKFINKQKTAKAQLAMVADAKDYKSIYRSVDAYLKTRKVAASKAA
ncbi:MAG: hypothetical protein FWD15_06295 [Alphaproteobacteria bacterium]|nr:hypothetical protein [Alphaproteobacteria bacterium]